LDRARRGPATSRQDHRLSAADSNGGSARRELAFFEQYDLEPNIAVARFWALAGIKPHPERVQEKLTNGNRVLAALDDHLRERTFVVGERYTIADICLYAYTHVADQGGFELSRYAAIGPWLESVAAQPRHIHIDA
jgi:glutathione S-transferase